jgi:hypothetical protein
MFFGIILVLILLFFCVVLSLTLAHITEALLPRRYAGYHLLPSAEQWLLKGIVYYPLFVSLLMLVIGYFFPFGGGDDSAAVFTAAHGMLCAIGAAVALKLKPQHKAYRVWYWVNIMLGGIYFLYAAAAIFKFD